MIDNSNHVILNCKVYACTPGEIAKSVFYYVQDVGYYSCGKGHTTSRTGMNSILLVTTLTGKAFLEYRNKKYIFKQGDSFFINCRDKHYYGTEGEKPWEFKFLHFYGNNSEKMYEYIYLMYGAKLSFSGNNILTSLLDELIKESEERTKFFEINTMAIIAKLLSETIKLSASRFGEIKNNKPNKIVDNAIEYMTMNYANNIVLKDLAEAAFTSKYHFSRIFKRITGSSPYAFLVNYRINISKEKLKTTPKSIGEIAVEVGFESTSNYIKIFKNIEGITPNTYRKIWKGTY